MSNILFKQGMTQQNIAASDKLAVYSKDAYKVYQLTGYPNQPDAWTLLKSGAPDEEYVSAAFSTAGVVRIFAGADNVLWQAGTDAVIIERRALIAQGAPTAMTTAATMTAAGLISGIVTGTHAAGATQAYVLPTGTLLDAALELDIGESFDWVLINLSAAAADTITVTAGADHTIVGNPIVQSAHSSTGGIYGNSSQWRSRKTAANTFVSYRIA